MSTAELSLPLGNSIGEALPRRLFSNLFSNDMAMDLGTANTLIYTKNRGIVLNEPSIVAVDEKNGKPLAVGHAAKSMYGKTPAGIRCIRPMKDGVIADFEMTTLMIQYMLKLAAKRLTFAKPRIVIGVPSGITQVEKKAVIDAALLSGAGKVMLVEEPMAAALGTGLPVHKSIGNMIVDIGGGTTEVAILISNQTLYSHSIRVAGDEMDEAIQRYIKKHYGLEIGILEAERVKLILGSALSLGKQRKVVVYGRDLTTGRPQKIEATDNLVRSALYEPIVAIISSITTALEQTTPEIAQDIISRGIYLAGGGSLLKGLSERLYRETGIKFVLAQDPLSCVVRGVGKIVDDLKELRVLCIN